MTTKENERMRTLNMLQLILERQIDELMSIDCDDPNAATAISDAVRDAERSLARTRDTQQNLSRSE